MKVHEMIRKYRKKKGMTQEEVANKLFVTKQAYNQYEKGKRKIETETFFRLGDILNIHISIRERYRNVDFPNLDELLAKVKYYKWEETNNVYLIYFFIGHEMFVAIIETDEEGQLLHGVQHLPDEVMFTEKEKLLNAIFKLYGEEFNQHLFSKACPYCSRYKERMEDLNDFDSYTCETLSNEKFILGLVKGIEALGKQTTEDKFENMKRVFFQANSKGDL